MINIGLSPNLRLADSLLALKLLFQPWQWKTGKEPGKLEEWFKKYLGVNQAVAFNSGRSAEYAILKSLGIKEGDEVLLQAFTCVAVPNSILWLGAKPIFVDIKSETLTMDGLDLERKITPKSKAIIVQHTFGLKADIDQILEIGKNHNLVVIEDCAHLIKKNLEGEAAFYSFGRDKAVSSIFGGMAVTSSKFPLQGKQVQSSKLEYPSYFWIFQQLLHPVVSMFILPLYNILEIGKVLLFILQKLHLLSLPVYEQEKFGGQPSDFPKKMPQALAVLAVNQLKSLDNFNQKRIEISKIYEEKLKNLPIRLTKTNRTPFLRYPILTEKAKNLQNFAKQRGVILGHWYTQVIDPQGVDLKKIGYQLGSCPVAEKVAAKIVNLPTYPRMTLAEAEKVVETLYDFYQRNRE